jgi:hypothetical protein
MTDTNNGWPGEPGVPLNPERDGAHRLRHQVSGLESDALWSCGGTWRDLNGDFSIPDAAAFYDYLGPCLTPDQATALQARVAELKHLANLADSWITAALECKDWHWDEDQHKAATHTRDELRAALEGKKT